MASVPETNRLLKELMEYDFALQELILFLDTHPNDCQALEMYTAVQERSKNAKKVYQANYGPLTADAVDAKDKWTWIQGPWPWEN